MPTSDLSRGALGVLLRHHRLALGLSQDELAERAALSKRGLADLERGVRRAPYPATLRRLATALDLSEAERARLTAAARASSAVPPATADDLLGREPDLAALLERLRTREVRLLTLVGAPGVGKTRLALSAAAVLASEYADGVCVVHLARVGSLDAVIPAIAAALGVHGAELEQVAAYLRRRQVLLVLDNCEHVLAAAPWVAELLSASPRQQILTTSRAPLRVRGEVLQPVAPLAVPSAATADPLEAPSVALFVRRAREVEPAFSIDPETLRSVGILCRRLDGLPLAIELAAARVRLLPPSAILDRLGNQLDVLIGGRTDDPARHQTLRSALDWSAALLAPADQHLLARLGVFVGGCTVEAAEAVAQSPETLSGLQSLADHSLLERAPDAGDGVRLTLLEPVRAYALELLDASGERDTARHLHAEYFLRVVESMRAELEGPDQLRALQRLDREWANVRAALAWFTERARAGDAAAAAHGHRLGGAVWWYMHVRGVYAELRQLLLPLLEPSPSMNAPRAAALRTAGIAAWGDGDYATARLEVETALAIQRKLDDRPGERLSLIALAGIGVSQGESALASAADEALAIATADGDTWVGAWALTFRGLFDLAAEDLPAARAAFEQAIALRLRLGDTFGLAWAQYGLASVERVARHHIAAEALFSAALGTFRTLGERPTVAAILDGLGDLALALDEPRRAREHFEASLALYLDLNSARGAGIAVSGLAAVAFREGRTERALRLAGAAAALQHRRGVGMEFVPQRGDADWLATATARLGDDVARAAWLSGTLLRLEDVPAEVSDSFKLATDSGCYGESYEPS